MDAATIALIKTGLVVGASGTVIYQLKAIPKYIWTKMKQKLIYTVKIYL